MTMKFSSVFLVVMCASSAFAQTTTPSVQRTANPELVGTLANALGGTPRQAEGAAGSLFSAAKGRMKPADWSQVASAVPGMSGLLKAAPPVAVGTSGSNELGSLAHSVGLGGIAGLGGVATAFRKLGLKPELIAQAIPVLTAYVSQHGGSRAAQQFASALR
jgi:hypothetical protein